MRRLFHALAIGLIGAGIAHIVILLLVPSFSERDAWSRLAMVAGPNKVVRLDQEIGGTPVVKALDPSFFEAACRFDLTEGVVRIDNAGKVPYWSASVYDRSGQNIYSFNDRTATDGNLDFVVLTPAQMIDLRKELPTEFEKSIFVETPIDEGIVVVRAFVPDDSWKPTVDRFLDGINCDIQ
ncbi:putative membrane protein [Aminobacter lissarensis]|uniref:Membrane protein n=1 Tax=Aminobacter carboxidus TaxID=376165 RepID=A0A8E1WEC5_9HYPH|nr:DUF1254 domain-containing protein [Aminobacter lissarensis]MBB6466892.1 putative membrane protein [Aminobacter lissarensis]